jgi:hypothetical protein
VTPTSISGALPTSSCNATAPTMRRQYLRNGDKFSAKGDEDGYAIWKAILGAILELRRTEPGEGGG